MPAWIGGRAVEHHDAIEAAGQLLGAARTMLVAGLTADVEAIEASYRLAARLGASIDPAGSNALYADLAVLAGSGAMATTFAEASARADCILVVGEGPWRSALLLELLNGVPKRGGTRGRVILSIGGSRTKGIETRVAVARSRLPMELALLRALAAARIPAAPEHALLADIAVTLARSAFGVIVYDPADLGDLGVEMLQGLVKDLNLVTRCTSLALSDPRPAHASLPVGVWMTGQAPRIGMARGFPEHDPWRFEAERLVASGECDAALWLASLPCEPAPWLAGQRGVALIGDPHGDEAEIVIGVGVPGDDAAGCVWDERRATLCYRKASRASDAVPAAQTLEAIAASALRAREALPC